MAWLTCLLWVALLDVASAARVKDISDLYGVRDNNLLGYGLVTGLRRTGDTLRNQATIQTLAKRLQGLGVTLTTDQIRARNVAVVMVTANFPSTARPGQKIDVVVSSAGDAISIEGGVLVTQLLALMANLRWLKVLWLLVGIITRLVPVFQKITQPLV